MTSMEKLELSVESRWNSAMENSLMSMTLLMIDTLDGIKYEELNRLTLRKSLVNLFNRYEEQKLTLEEWQILLSVHEDEYWLLLERVALSEQCC